MLDNISSRKFLKLFYFRDMLVLQGSDHHVPVEMYDRYVASLIAQIKAASPDFVILNGDLFNNPDGQNIQPAIGDLLRDVAKGYFGKVFFVPGNHCLRGKGDVWSNFGKLPENVCAPLENPTQPVIVESNAGRIVLGNIFYDSRMFDFNDFSSDAFKIIGFNFTEQDTIRLYNKGKDGEHLFGGCRDLFPLMADNLVAKMGPDVAMLITHCLPHSSIVQFRVAELTNETSEIERKYGVSFICNPEEDERDGRIWGTEAEGNNNGNGNRIWWNSRSMMMGSDVLSRAALHDSLVVVFGHNHLAEDDFPRLINGKTVTTQSFQSPLRFDGPRWRPKPVIIPDTVARGPWVARGAVARCSMD